MIADDQATGEMETLRKGRITAETFNLAHKSVRETMRDLSIRTTPMHVEGITNMWFSAYLHGVGVGIDGVVEAVEKLSSSREENEDDQS